MLPAEIFTQHDKRQNLEKYTVFLYMFFIEKMLDISLKYLSEKIWGTNTLAGETIHNWVKIGFAPHVYHFLKKGLFFKKNDQTDILVWVYTVWWGMSVGTFRKIRQIYHSWANLADDKVTIFSFISQKIE